LQLYTVHLLPSRNSIPISSDTFHSFDLLDADDEAVDGAVDGTVDEAAESVGEAVSEGDFQGT